MKIRKLYILTGTLLVLTITMQGQVSNPSVVAVPSTPSACNTLPLQVVQGTPNLYGTNGSGGCTAIGGGGGGGGASTSGTAVSVAKVCGSSDTNCFTVYDDVQTAMGAVYTNTASGGNSATLKSLSPLTQAGVEYGSTSLPGVNGVTMTAGASGAFVATAAAFSTSGPYSVGTCWGHDGTVGATASISVSVSPVGGAGHALMAFATSYQTPSQASSYVFSDASNTWHNIVGGVISGAFTGTQAYALNVVGGTYNVTVTPNISTTFQTLYVCEVSGITAFLSGAGQAATAAASSINVTANAVNNFVFAARADSPTATYTAGTIGGFITVDTNASDPAFVLTDVGKSVLASTNCDPANGYINCLQSMSAGTIHSYVSAHEITVAAAPTLASVTSGTGFTGWFLWGHDDGAQIAAAFAKSITLPNSVLSLPCGTAFISVPPFLSTSTGAVYNPNINGCGTENGTVLVPTPDFNYSIASVALIYSYPHTNESGRGSGVSFQNPFERDQISNLTIWGGGLDGANVTSNLPIIKLNATQLINVKLVGWNWNANTNATNGMSAFEGYGFLLRGGGAWSAGASNVHYLGDSIFGLIGGASDCQVGVMGTYSGGALSFPAPGLTIETGHFTSTNCQFYPPSGIAGDATLGAQQNGGVLNLFGGSVGGIKVHGGTANLKGTATTSLNHFGVVIDNAAGTVNAQTSQIDKLTISNGLFVDQGENVACSVAQTTSYLQCSPFTYVPWTANPTGNSISGGSIRGNAGSFLYSAAGTALPSTSAPWKGWGAMVSDATAPLYNTNYTSGGAVPVPVISDGTNYKTH